MRETVDFKSAIIDALNAMQETFEKGSVAWKMAEELKDEAEKEKREAVLAYKYKILKEVLDKEVDALEGKDAVRQ